MALSPADAAKLQQQLQEIERLSRLLGANINTINLQPIEANAGNIEAIFERLTNQAAGLGEETDYLVSNFQKLIGEIKKSGTGINESTKALRSLSSITEQISNYQKGYSDLSSKEITKLRDKAKIETDRLKIARQTIEDETYELTLQSQSASFTSLSVKQQQAILDKLAKNQIARENINNLLENEDVTLGELNNKLKEAEDNAKHIEKTLGLTGATLKGISKIPLLGDIIDTNSALEAAKDNIKEGGDRTSAMKAAFKNMGGQIKTNLTDPMVVTGFLVTQMTDALIKGDTATGDLAKDFNITYDAAAGVRNELIEIGNLSGNIALNARALQESMVAVGKSLGSNAMLNQQDLETFTELREMAGYTNEELIGMQKITLATGGNLKDNTKQFLGTVSALNAQNKLTVNEKQLLKEVANTSAAIKLSVGGTAKGLAEAAFKAKEFGINLEQADRIAESLLDFESSITAELSAELITGKDLNLEKARLLALNGDIAGASAEILKQVKGSAEFTKMNRIQQEALAKAVGMSREDLAASLIEREALSKLGEKDKTGIEAYNRLKKEGLSDAQIAIELGNEQYATQLKQQSIQGRFNQSVEKLKEIFISLAEPILQILSPLMDLVTFVLPAINYALSPIMEGFRVIGVAIDYIKQGWGTFTDMLAPIMPILKGIGIAALVVLSPLIALAGAAAFMSMAAIPVVGPVLATAAALGAISFLTTKLTGLKIQDGMIAPDGGLVVSGPKGTYSLDKNDSVIAGTNLNKPTDRSATTQPEIDLSPLLAEMKALRQEQTRANNKPTIVENSVNGTRFGTAVAMNTYKVQ